MTESTNHRSCIPGCKLSVPTELGSVGLCVYHFTWSVEGACAEMHRQIALRQATSQRRAYMATYIAECGLLLARVTASLCLSDDLKRRILCAFQSLMNLKENMERVPGANAALLRAPFPAFAAPPSRDQDWLNSRSNALLRPQV